MFLEARLGGKGAFTAVAARRLSPVAAAVHRQVKLGEERLRTLAALVRPRPAPVGAHVLPPHRLTGEALTAPGDGRGGVAMSIAGLSSDLESNGDGRR